MFCADNLVNPRIFSILIYIETIKNYIIQSWKKSKKIAIYQKLYIWLYVSEYLSKVNIESDGSFVIDHEFDKI